MKFIRSKALKSFFSLAIALALLLNHGSPVSAATQPAPSVIPLIQFTSDGKVLGFATNKVFLANGSNVYHVEFVGAAQTSPISKNTQSGTSQVVPLLGRVLYSNLWPWVTLSYAAPAEGRIKG